MAPEADEFANVPEKESDAHATGSAAAIAERTQDDGELRKCVKGNGEGLIWDKFAGLSFADIRVRCKHCAGLGVAPVPTNGAPTSADAAPGTTQSLPKASVKAAPKAPPTSVRTSAKATP